MRERFADLRLYLITDRKLFPHSSSLIDAVETALRAGVKAVQLREKELPVRDLLTMAYRMREVTTRYGAKFFVNDRIDIALCVEADGVHLGLSGIPLPAARKVAGKKLLIGASTHNLDEALAAEREGADFITFGPVYDTPSKRHYGAPVGLEALKVAVGQIALPVLGIGGITPERAGEVMRAGAHGVALIRGILGEADIKGAAKKYLNTVGCVPHPS
jgi:thiamine-phosphate pyrophosphorylase